MTKIPLEKEIQKEILKKLWELKVFAWRNNSGMYLSSYKEKTRMISYGLAGSSDIIAITSGLFVGIEVKRPGGVQTEAQRAFQRNVEGAGGYYILATSPKEAEDGLKLINS